ncbi:pirin family protein [filamentous cyanobacterium LEGE 11480]|uniref:Pirin family protein n=1 Tax=Romeriopsis navalis LEGE 11480 TaxID=2777977 RepID=A0A928VSJ4_9CYAN|nr:pirin family protein [Romeriopsis navalis]MBE9032963.1 pirin family protein [Romeriopsis navalis LEGE 11480]
MLNIRRSADRGQAHHGWLDSYHSFSFANYYDPQHMQFRSLRVINEDIIAAGQGFGTHPHNDMEIITYVLDGAIKHQDSMGNGSIIQPGDVQRMSAGTGITHSEFNPLPDTATHLLQIWIVPEQTGIAPSYEQKQFPRETKQGQLRLLASRNGRAGSVTVHQDLNLYATVLDAGESVTMSTALDRHYWIQVARGTVIVNGEALNQGDAIGLTAETEMAIAATDTAEVLVFDLA